MTQKNQVDVKSLSVIELKAMKSDSYEMIQNAQNNLNVINAELQRRVILEKEMAQDAEQKFPHEAENGKVIPLDMKRHEPSTNCQMATDEVE